MIFFLQFVAIGIASVYFVGVTIILALAFLDRQKDSTMENRIVAVIIFFGFILAPLIAIFASLR